MAHAEIQVRDVIEHSYSKISDCAWIQKKTAFIIMSSGVNAKRVSTDMFTLNSEVVKTAQLVRPK